MKAPKHTRTLCIGGLAVLAGGSLLAAALPAQAQEASSVSEFERPYGFGFGDESRPFSANTRDRLGNRVIINGLIQTGVGVSAQLGLNSGVGSTSTAIGNQLNVNVTGRWNTVIINSTQINNGDINANAQSTGSVSDPDDEN